MAYVAATPDARERVLVAIAPDENLDRAEHMLRAAHRHARAFNADWTVICVETPAFLHTQTPQNDSRHHIFRLAESLGAERATLVSAAPPEALQEYARLRRVHTVLVGAPRQRPGWWPLQRSTADLMMRCASDFDVIVIARQGVAPGNEAGAAPGIANLSTWSGLTPYFWGVCLTALSTLLAVPMLDHFDLIDMAMVYMLGATVAALRLGRGPAVLTSLANIAAFDFFIVPPRFSLYFTDPHYYVTFGVMLAVTIIIANLVAAVRQQTLAAAARERRTEALYAMSRELAVTRDADTMAAIAERHIAEVLRSAVAVLVQGEHGRLRQRRESGGPSPDMKICEWVWEHHQRAGLGCEHFGAARSMYLPLMGGENLRGVLIVTPSDPRQALLLEQSRLLEALANQLALALERVRLGELAEAAHVLAERTALRNTLLASISHDLRTPLSAIAGAGSMLALSDGALDVHRSATLGRLIEDKARDMTALLSNVLELLRLETGCIAIKREWHAVEDLIGTTLQRHQVGLTRWRVFVDVPAELPMVYVEATMLVQMLGNILENCTKYTPPETTIHIAARALDDRLVISIEDNGPGFPPGDPERLFDKFERGRTESNVAGVGLGLAICRALARLHDGEIRAMRVATGGSRFEITLPIAAASLPSTAAS